MLVLGAALAASTLSQRGPASQAHQSGAGASRAVSSTAVVDDTTRTATTTTGPANGPAHAAAAWSPVRTQHDAFDVAPREPDDATRAQQLAALFDRRAKAVAAGDPVAWLRTVDVAAAPRLARPQAQTFANLHRIAMGTWRYDVLVDVPHAPVAGPEGLRPARTVKVGLTFAVRGYDDVPLQREQTFVVRLGDQGWRIADDLTGIVDQDLWDVAPVTVQRGDSAVVVVADGADVPKHLADTVDEAVQVVGDALGDRWSEHTVVEVPASEQQAVVLQHGDGALDPGAYAAWAQLEAISPRRFGAHGPHRISTSMVVSPHAFDGLDDETELDILAHEMTHVAFFGWGTGGATWLSEGVADDLGFGDWRVQDLAPDVLKQWRNGWRPSQPPKDADFTGKNSIDLAYQRSVTLVRAMDRRWGVTAVRRAVQDIAAQDWLVDLEDAETTTRLLRDLHTTRPQLMAAWADYLRAAAANKAD